MVNESIKFSYDEMNIVFLLNKLVEINEFYRKVLLDIYEESGISVSRLTLQGRQACLELAARQVVYVVEELSEGRREQYVTLNPAVNKVLREGLKETFILQIKENEDLDGGEKLPEVWL